MFKFFKEYKYRLVGLSFIYIFFCRKAKDLWFENDFRQTFPEIFSPYTRRFDMLEKEETIMEVYNSLRRIEELDIVSRRKNKKSNKKETVHINIKDENNFNKLRT